MSNIITANDLSNIGSLMSVSANQLITLQAEVIHISQVKDMPTLNHGELKKQDVMIRDPTGTTKLVLWEKYVDTLVINTTYKFENLKVKSFNNERYLNTPKDKQFNATEIEPFQHELPEPEQVIEAPSISGRIIGVKDVISVTACSACQKSTIEPLENSTKLGQCQNKQCNTVELLDSCDLHWSLRLVVKASEPSDGAAKRNITLYHQQVLVLLSTFNINLNLNTATDVVLATALLEVAADAEVQISYEANTNKMLSISIV
jgi:hypothetical protein